MKLLFSTALLAAAMLQGYSQDAAPVNCELATVLQIDGNAKEWPMEWIVDEDKKFSYNVCGDDNNIYIRWRTQEELVKRKIALFGFTIWLDPNGKKKKKLGLRFPTGAEAKDRMEAMRESGESKMANMSSSQRAEFQKEVTRKFVQDIELLELIGLANDPLTSTRSGITNGIKVAIATDEDEAYVYEAIIPFKSYRLSKASIEELGIGFETGKYEPPPSKTAAPSGAGPQYQGPTGGYGGNGYSSGRAMRGSSGQNYKSNPMGNSSYYWVSVKLK